MISETYYTKLHLINISKKVLLMGGAVLPPHWLLGLRRSSPGVHRLDGRAEGWLQKDLGQHTLQDCRSPMPPSPWQAAANPRLFKGPSNTPREVGLSLLGVTAPSPASWWVHGCAGAL